MVNALKKMDKKFLIIAGCIIFLPIFIIVFLAIIQGCGNSKITYEEYEEKMLSAAQKYITKEDQEPIEEGEVVKIKLATLVKNGYIKSSEKLLDDTTCEGFVSVRRNGASIESTNGGYLDYIVNLECKNHSTMTLVNKIKENLVTSDAGLYADGDGYIFKGEDVKNYISYFGNSYRIYGIDKNGILKLVKSEPEITSRIWDNKYNVETNKNSGINIYKDSIILKYLINDYENPKKINSKARSHIVAYDVCVGKRNNTNLAIDSSLDCSETMEKQVISLLNVSDYAKASLDVNCTDLKARSCSNYNYLSRVLSSTWTLNSSLDNTFEVLYLSEGLMYFKTANTNNQYNIVIYIDGNSTYKSGSGSKLDPYVFE